MWRNTWIQMQRLNKTYEPIQQPNEVTSENADRIRYKAQQCIRDKKYEEAIKNFKTARSIYLELGQHGFWKTDKHSTMEYYARQCLIEIAGVYVRMSKFAEASNLYLTNITIELDSHSHKLSEELFNGILCSLVVSPQDHRVANKQLMRFYNHRYIQNNYDDYKFLDRLMYRLLRNKNCQELIDSHEDLLQYTDVQRLCLAEIAKRSNISTIQYIYNEQNG